MRSDASGPDQRGPAPVLIAASAGTGALVSIWALTFISLTGADSGAVVVGGALAGAAAAATTFRNGRRRHAADATAFREWAIGVLVLMGAVGIGLVGLRLSLPAGLFDPHGPLWDLPGGDRGASTVGARYFLADDWHWPLLRTDDLGTPDGVVIAFTDSIPLLALPVKALRSLLGSDLNYFPAWFFLAYSMQGVAAVALLRSMGIRRATPLLAAATLAVAFPPFITRTGHAALIGQFTVLLVLAAAVWACRADGAPRRHLLVAPALAAALLVHPYLLLMSIPLLTGIYLDALRRRAITIPTAALAAGASGVLLGIVVVAGGYVGAYSAATDYGLYGMNVLGPFVPQLSGLTPGDEGVLGGHTPRGEGFNWLGVGTLALLAVCLATRWRAVLRLLDRWLLTVAAASALTVVAVSHLVVVGRSDHVFELSAIYGRAGPRYLVLGVVVVLLAVAAMILLGRLRGRPVLIGVALAVPALVVTAFFGHLLDFLAPVRASGRLWWPIGLLVTLVPVAVVARARWRAAPFILAAAALLQVVDTGPVRAQSKRTVTTVSIAGEQVLVDAMEAASSVSVTPSFFCAAYEITPDILHLTLVASRAGTVPIDTAYTARNSGEGTCPTSVTPAGDDVLLALALPFSRDPGRLLDDDHRCRSNGTYLVCTDGWRGLPVASTDPWLPLLSEPVTFGAGGDAPRVLVDGWPEPDAAGRNVPGGGATVEVPLIEPAGTEALVRLRLRAVAGPATLLLTEADGTVHRVPVLPGPASDHDVTLTVTGTDSVALTLASADPANPVSVETMSVLLGPDRT